MNQLNDGYDPTTGQLRSSSTDDITDWFVDSDYDPHHGDEVLKVIQP